MLLCSTSCSQSRSSMIDLCYICISVRCSSRSATINSISSFSSMVDASHLERMGRELKCPICLSLFNSAVSLTCNHVFCNSCIQKSMKMDSSCPVCKVPCTRREVRPAPHMENLVHIYKSMEIASGLNIFLTQNDAQTRNSDEEEQAEGGCNTTNTKFSTKRVENNGKLSKSASKSKLKSPGTKPVKRSFCTNKRVQVPRSPLPETPINLVTSKPEREAMNCVPKSGVPSSYTRLNGNSSHLLGPLFWLREDADKLSQSTDIEHLTLTPVNVPNFSDIKDSDDDLADEVVPREEVSSKRDVASLFDSEMFEWTQRACSPELCSTPIKNQAPPGDVGGRLDQISGTPTEGGTIGRVTAEYCEELNPPEKIHAKNVSASHNPETKFIDKPNGYGKSRKRTSNGRTRSQSKRTKNNQENDVAADSVDGFVSDEGCGLNSPLNNLEEELLNQVDKSVAAKGMALRNRTSCKSNKHQSTKQARSKLQSDLPKLDRIIEVTPSQQKDCEGRLLTKSLREKKPSTRVDKCSASSTGRKSRKCGQEVNCKGKVDVSRDIDLIDKQDNLNVGTHAESADTKDPYHSLKAGNVVRKCQSNSNRIICGFCHSAEETEFTGQMINYYQGRPVSSDFVGGSNIIHSHKSCTEWAPNVYFQDDIAINLEAELARSWRIKCSLCMDKGAALGCYDKSCRRSFHVPCAKRLKQNRWDTDNFVMLCPLHASSKLPNEQTETQVKRKNNSKSTQSKSATKQGTDTSLWDSRGCSDKLHLCCSAFTAGDEEIVTKFKRLSGASVSKNWNTSVTHVIASTDENGACKRTLKVLMGILEGKWILSIEWIKACLNAIRIVDESTYEINVDSHGIKGGPRLGRLRLENKQPKVFSGMKFYLTGDFEVSYRGYLHELIISAGATVLHRKPLVEEQGNMSLPLTIIVYSLELSDKNDDNKEMILKSRQEEAEAIAKSSGCKAVSNLWVLNCICGYKLQPLPGSTV